VAAVSGFGIGSLLTPVLMLWMPTAHAVAVLAIGVPILGRMSTNVYRRLIGALLLLLALSLVFAAARDQRLLTSDS
jgi:uncharacterized membrane protein YfcA